MTLSAGEGKLAVDRATGLVRYRVGEGPWMVGGAPNFYRAPTDSDLGTGTEAIRLHGRR
jgi:beta-galactosidase